MIKIYAHHSEFPMSEWRWPSFSPKELACKGTGKLAIDVDAMDKLQALRNRLGKPVILNSAYRSESHNRRVGGAKKSKHLEAKAFDVNMANHNPVTFERVAKDVGFTGFGFYKRNNFIHIDIGRAREWGKRWFESTEAVRVPETIAEDKGLITGVLAGGGGAGIMTEVAVRNASELSDTTQIILAVAVVAVVGLIAWSARHKIANRFL